MEMDGVEKMKIQMQEWVQKAEVFVKQIPEPQLYGGIGVIWLTTLLLLLVRLFKRTKPNTVVLSGLSGSGKTVLFYQGTITSMEPNDGTFDLHSEMDNKKAKLKPIHIVDVPGHSRLRPKIDEFLPQTAGVVFLVDALEFLPNCRAVSEYIYDILTKASVARKKIPLLLVCNKVDKPSAHSKEIIRKQLEKEIDKLRTSRTSVSDADVANEYTLGLPGKAFAFTLSE